jgi:hypothetical protein
MTKLTYYEWEEKYKPISNPDSFEGDIIFEVELGKGDEFVKEYGGLHIWTDVDGDEANVILNGWHFVNRICYYVTEVPFEEGEVIEVLIRYYDDEEGDEDEWRD